LQQAGDEFWQYRQQATSTRDTFHDTTYRQTYFGFLRPNQMFVGNKCGRTVNGLQDESRIQRRTPDLSRPLEFGIIFFFSATCGAALLAGNQIQIS
jgi:hypothetical protein